MILSLSRIRLIGAIAVSIVVTVSFGAVLALYLSQKAAGIAPSDTLSIMVGTLASNFTSVVQYWVGSSIGSHQKDEARDEMLRKNGELH